MATTEDPTGEALDLVIDERERQNAKWAGRPGEWAEADGVRLAVLVEEVGEVARTLCDDESDERREAELVQVAAVAVRWIEAIRGERAAREEVERRTTASGRVHRWPVLDHIHTTITVDGRPIEPARPAPVVITIEGRYPLCYVSPHSAHRFARDTGAPPSLSAGGGAGLLELRREKARAAKAAK